MEQRPVRTTPVRTRSGPGAACKEQRTVRRTRSGSSRAYGCVSARRTKFSNVTVRDMYQQEPPNGRLHVRATRGAALAAESQPDKPLSCCYYTADSRGFGPDPYSVQDQPPSAQGTTLPVQDTTLPVQGAALPVQGTTLPVQGTTLPVQSTTLPVQGTTVPVQGATLPVQGTPLPVQDTSARVGGSAQKADQPSSAGTPPVRKVKPIFRLIRQKPPGRETRTTKRKKIVLNVPQLSLLNDVCRPRGPCATVPADKAFDNSKGEILSPISLSYLCSVASSLQSSAGRSSGPPRLGRPPRRTVSPTKATRGKHSQPAVSGTADGLTGQTKRCRKASDTTTISDQNMTSYLLVPIEHDKGQHNSPALEAGPQPGVMDTNTPDQAPVSEPDPAPPPRRPAPEDRPGRPSDGRPAQKTAEYRPSVGRPAQRTAEDRRSDGRPAKRTAEYRPSVGRPAKRTAEDRPSDGRPAQRTAEDRPSDGRPAQRTAEDRPSDGRPAQRTAEDRPSDGRPAQRTAEDHRLAALEHKTDRILELLQRLLPGPPSPAAPAADTSLQQLQQRVQAVESKTDRVLGLLRQCDLPKMKQSGCNDVTRKWAVREEVAELAFRGLGQAIRLLKSDRKPTPEMLAALTLLSDATGSSLHGRSPVSRSAERDSSVVGTAGAPSDRPPSSESPSSAATPAAAEHQPPDGVSSLPPSGLCYPAPVSSVASALSGDSNDRGNRGSASGPASSPREDNDSPESCEVWTSSGCPPREGSELLEASRPVDSPMPPVLHVDVGGGNLGVDSDRSAGRQAGGPDRCSGTAPGQLPCRRQSEAVTASAEETPAGSAARPGPSADRLNDLATTSRWRLDPLASVDMIKYEPWDCADPTQAARGTEAELRHWNLNNNPLPCMALDAIKRELDVSDVMLADIPGLKTELPGPC